jgi:hypothetical protein
MINFPDSPTLNQIFLAPNGVAYTYNGTLWLVQNLAFARPVMQLDNEVVLGSSAASMTITIPAAAKAIEIWFYVANAGNANDASGLILNDVQSGTPNVGANHNAQTLSGGGTVAAATGSSGAGGWQFGGTQATYLGCLRVQIIGGFAYINADYVCFNAAGSSIKFQVAYWGGLTGVTGFRMINGSATAFAAGSYMRVLALL